MLAYQRGDLSAFEVLYGRHKHGLFGFISRQCPLQWTEDIAQETWMAVVDSAHRYQSSARFKTYLYSIAHNKSVDRWRRHTPDHMVAVTEQHSDSIPGDTGGTQEQQLTYARALKAVQELPSEQRDAFLLKEQGFSLDDIAEITAVGRETVKSRLRYAVQALRQLFEVSV